MSIRMSLPVLVLAAGITGVSGHSGLEPRPSPPAAATRLRSTIADLDYVRGVYYILYDPNLDALQIDSWDIQLYLDDYNYGNDQNSVPGRAFMDKGHTAGENGTYGDPLTSDTTSVRGTFTLLFPGADQDYEILEMYGPRFKVIRLTRSIAGEQKLAVSYRARRVSANTPGPTFRVGGMDTLDTDGVTRRYLKLLRPPASLVNPDPATGFFTRDSLFALTRDLELKNFYQLPGQQIDPATFRLTVRRGVSDPPLVSIPEPGGGSVPYLEAVGLDSYDETSGHAVPGHDGKLDGTYLSSGSQQTFFDYENGILFLPDPRPFAPRIGDAYRLTPGGQSLFPFDQAVSNVVLRRDSLVGPLDAANGAHVAIYDKYDVHRWDAVYWMDFEFNTPQPPPTFAPDSVVLAMSALHWIHSSAPQRKSGIGLDRSILADTLVQQRNAEVAWFTTISAVKESDLMPNLTDAVGAQNSHPSLAISVPRRPKNATPDDTLWAGLTYLLDPVGFDLSRARFIEVWVNDFHDSTSRAASPNRFMKLHVDLGQVNEDQMRSPDVTPNLRLDTEDRSEGGAPPDRRLDASEDTGYDNLFDAEEQAAGVPIHDLTTASPEDPEGDDFHPVSGSIPPDDINPDDFRGSNGTEGNHTVNPHPDTEDLNLDNILQTREDVFEYTVALCDTCHTYLITNVQRDYSGAPVPHPPSATNGWRRYIIPIADAQRAQFGVPDLTLSRHVRVWLEGIMDIGPADRPLLMLGGLKIVGSRRLAAPQRLVPGAIKPNPFQTDVVVEFTLVRAGPVDLVVYDVLGREVRAVARGQMLGAGTQSLRWDGRDARGREAGAGVYFMRVKAESATWTRAVVRVR